MCLTAKLNGALARPFEFSVLRVYLLDLGMSYPRFPDLGMSYLQVPSAACGRNQTPWYSWQGLERIQITRRRPASGEKCQIFWRTVTQRRGRLSLTSAVCWEAQVGIYQQLTLFLAHP